MFRILFYIILSGTISVNAQSPKFLREIITITVHDDKCSLNGSYYFVNPGSQRTESLLFYPFVIDEDLLYPDSIRIFSPTLKKDLPYSKTDKGIFFKISLDPGDTSLYSVYYSQKTPVRRMEYILTTTRNWQRPLGSAEFLIKIPFNCELTFSSYEFDRVERGKVYTEYYVKNENFMPERDLKIKWSENRK